MVKKSKTKIKPNEETKQHPVALDKEKDISISAKEQKAFVEKIHNKSMDDINSSTNHRQKLAHWYDRRFGTLNKEPQYPWPGSSNITMPLIDMEVTKDKAPLMQMFEVQPIVSFQAMTPRAFDQTDAGEHTMQWLLTSRMRDFKKNMEIVVDNRGTYGYGVAKTIYEYKTQTISETIRRSEFSEEEMSEIAVLIAAVESGQPVGQDQQTGEPVVPTEEDLDIVMSQITAERFGLNSEDEVDQKAITDIMNFIIGDKDEVTIKRNFIVHDAPYVDYIDPTRVFIEEGATSFDDAERITEIFHDTINEMKSKAQTGWYDSDAVDKILSKFREGEDAAVDNSGSDGSKSDFSQLDNEKRQREGITATTRSDVVENRELYCMYDINNDGVKEKCLLIYNAATLIPLRFMEFPYEYDGWPYDQIRYEETDGRFFSSRGIGEVINDIDDMITQNHRNKLNAMQIGNSPTFKYRLGSNINPNNMQWTPGQFFPVMNMNDFEQVNVQVKDFSFDNEEGILKFWNEGLLGSFDATFRDQKSEARTAKEVGAIQGVQQSAQSLKIARFQRDMKKIYKKIWSLWMQFGPPEFTATASNGQLTQLSKHEVNGEFELVPVGTIGNANPEAESARANQRFDRMLQVLTTVGPEGLQQLVGDKYELDMGGMLKDIFNKDDFVASNRLMRQRTPEEIQQIQQQRQQAQQAQQQQAQQEEAANANREVPISELQGTLKNMEKQAPNGGAQRVSF